MSGRGIDDARLRAAYRSVGVLEETRDGCPEPERLWSAMQGELAEAEALTVLDHASACPACIAASRLARDLAQRPAEQETPARGAPRRVPHRALAAAAVVVLGLVTLPFVLRQAEPPGASPIRAPSTPEISSVIEESGPLSRDRCVLGWTAPPGAVSYRVDVTTDDLRVVFSTRGLTVPEVRIPTADLDRVPSGGRILWRVEAMLPGGTLVLSPTFSNTVD